MRTIRQRHGAKGEDIAVSWLEERQWRVIDRNIRIGTRDEIDVLALDPGPPMELVCVEVRFARSRAFGAPEERVDRAKVAHMYRAMRAVRVDLNVPRRVDLIVVDATAGEPVIRHLKRLEPV